jgi:hypothetical protein
MPPFRGGLWGRIILLFSIMVGGHVFVCCLVFFCLGLGR